MADFLADYGHPPGPLDPETVFGLVMNQPRASDRLVYRVGLAVSLALGRGEVPGGVVAAACDSPEQAEDLHWTINADRAQAAAGF